VITDKFLLDVIRCPACHGEFDVHEDSLTCRGCGRTYPVRDGIPVLLLDEATRDEATRDEATRDEASGGREAESQQPGSDPDGVE
jgi:uncharacterized protein